MRPETTVKPPVSDHPKLSSLCGRLLEVVAYESLELHIGSKCCLLAYGNFSTFRLSLLRLVEYSVCAFSL